MSVRFDETLTEGKGYLVTSEGRTGERPSVVGIGALNVDVVVDAAAARRSGVRPPGGAGRDAESSVDSAEMARLLAAVADMPRQVRLGGSAYNTVVRLARERPDLALGFVGVAGEPPFGARGHDSALRELRVDTVRVRRTPETAGVCVAIEDGDARDLRVNPGANLLMATYLREAFEEVVAYVARARVVHVTSFLDSSTPKALLALLEEVRRRSPRTAICLDPGDEWCARPSADVAALLALADYVVVNAREFAGVSDLVRGTAVVKHPDGVDIWHGGTHRAHIAHTRLPASEIRNPTGAGDAFAAGLLAGLGVSDAGAAETALEQGVHLGLRMARAHLLGRHTV